MYNDLFDIGPNNKEMAVGILVTVAVLVAIFCAGYLLGLRNVSDHGGGADATGVQLEPIIVHQHEITTGIQEAAGTGGAIAESGGAIKESAGAIAGGGKVAGRLIDECQQIVGRVRNRGKK